MAAILNMAVYAVKLPEAVGLDGPRIHGGALLLAAALLVAAIIVLALRRERLDALGAALAFLAAAGVVLLRGG